MDLTCNAVINHSTSDTLVKVAKIPGRNQKRRTNGQTAPSTNPQVSHTETQNVFLLRKCPIKGSEFWCSPPNNEAYTYDLFSTCLIIWLLHFLSAVWTHVAVSPGLRWHQGQSLTSFLWTDRNDSQDYELKQAENHLLMYQHETWWAGSELSEVSVPDKDVIQRLLLMQNSSCMVPLCCRVGNTPVVLFTWR